MTTEIETVVILGAGASAAVTSGTAFPLPTDDTLLQIYHDLIAAEHQLLGMALSILIGDNWHHRRFEEVWSAIDDRYNMVPPLSLGQREREFYALFHLLAEEERRRGGPFYYARRYPRDERVAGPEILIHAGWECHRLAQRIYGKLVQGYDRQRYVRRVPEMADSKSCAVISFNYDKLYESSLDPENFYHYPLQPAKGILVLKPHGSANWRQTIDTRTDASTIEYTPGPLGLDEFGYQGADLVQSFLVGLRRKHELKVGVRGGEVGRLCQEILDACASVLGQARHTIVVGHRFPPADVYFREVLMRAKASRSRPMELVRFINLEKNPERRQEARGYWETFLNHVFWTADVKVCLEGF